MVRKGPDDGLLSFAALVKPRMGSPPSSLADEAAAAAALATAADDAATRAAAAAAKAALLQATAEVTAALQAQKALVVETHHRFELKYVAFKGAEAMRESSSNAATSKAAMVDVATRCTALDESELRLVRPGRPPERVGRSQGAQRHTERAAHGALHSTTPASRRPARRTMTQASQPMPSPSLSPPCRAWRHHRGRGGRATNAPSPRETTMSPATTTLTSSPPPSSPARSPPPDSATAATRDQGRGAQDDLGGELDRGARTRVNDARTSRRQGTKGATSSAVRRSTRGSAARARPLRWPTAEAETAGG